MGQQRTIMAAFSNCAVWRWISFASVAASRLLLVVTNLVDGALVCHRGSDGGDLLVTDRSCGLSSFGTSSAGRLLVAVKLSLSHRCMWTVVAVDGVAWFGQAFRPVL